MTTAALLVCSVCDREFAPEDPSRRGPKPKICPQCVDRYLNPPDTKTSVDNRVCRICDASITVTPGKQGKYFCDGCTVIRRRVYLQDKKAKERAGAC